jgi:hypothetical protein
MENNKQNGSLFEESWAIGVTWYIPSNHRRQFRKEVERMLLPHLITLHGAQQIVAVLPFHHRPLKVREESSDNSWTDYWVIVLAERVDPNEVWHSIESSARAAASLQDKLVRAEALRPQPTLDMYYPRIDGIAREPTWHWIEYVVSRPESRDAYYRDQYTFSGPVIRRFYEANAVRRCIGFECVRLLENNGALPEWDVVHITGFTPMRLVQIMWDLWRFIPVFNKIAREIGYASALAVLRSWDVKRVKYQRLAVQDRSYTLQPVHHEAQISPT